MNMHMEAKLASSYDEREESVQPLLDWAEFECTSYLKITAV